MNNLSGFYCTINLYYVFTVKLIQTCNKNLILRKLFLNQFHN